MNFQRISLIAASLAAIVVFAAAAQAPTITKRTTIGCESCSGFAQFGAIFDVSIAANGDVLVTDRDAPMLRRFDQTGKVIWTGGRKGEGPGEYRMPYRAALVPDGIAIVDMTNHRVTRLGVDGRIAASVPLLSFSSTAGVNARGDVAMGMDDMGRAFRVVELPAGGAELKTIIEFRGSMKNKALAIGPDGGLAVMLDGEKYEIQRINAAGQVIDTLRRDLPRPRRTAVEEAEYRQRLNRDLGAMTAELKKQGVTEKVSAPSIPPDERGLKPHIVVDGLRYDASGRLWVETMQGDETRTVFDVFSPTGTFLGAVTVPMRVSGFGLGGNWLATAGENEDGIPVVVLWTVK